MQNDEGQSGQSIHNIVYCSQAAQHMDKESIDRIITTSKYNNPRFGITGLLTFGSGFFFQWLEGPEDNVTSLFKIISADPRHWSCPNSPDTLTFLNKVIGFNDIGI